AATGAEHPATAAAEDAAARVLVAAAAPAEPTAPAVAAAEHLPEDQAGEQPVATEEPAAAPPAAVGLVAGVLRLPAVVEHDRRLAVLARLLQLGRRCRRLVALDDRPGPR